MKLDEAQFMAILSKGSIYRKLGESLLPYEPGHRAKSKEEFLRMLLADIKSGTYFPSVPRGYVVFDKHRYVPRITQVLSDRDACVYYYCVKQLEDSIALNRVEGTFGGWTLGNPIRELESRERELDGQLTLFKQLKPVAHGPYGPVNSVNPPQWSRNWVAFTHVVYEKSRRSEYGAFVKFDIANFYDTIRLDLLERKIRAECPGSQGPVIDLLFLFLRHWNRQFEEFRPKMIGIPQEEIGDCSRLLANFYLQDYDASVASACSKLSQPGQYVRFADDQVIMAPTLRDARNLLVGAAVQLHQIGLNLNSGKVIEFVDRSDFDHYWAFEYFELLEKPVDSAKINKAARKFVEQMDCDRATPRPRPWRWESVLKRFVSIGLDEVEEPMRSQIVDIFLDEELLFGLTEWTLKRIAPTLTEEQRERLVNRLDDRIALSPFTGFLLNVRKFYKESMLKKPIDEIDMRLDELSYF